MANEQWEAGLAIKLHGPPADDGGVRPALACGSDPEVAGSARRVVGLAELRSQLRDSRGERRMEGGCRFRQPRDRGRPRPAVLNVGGVRERDDLHRSTDSKWRFSSTWLVAKRFRFSPYGALLSSVL
jgi:hypothetical protein